MMKLQNFPVLMMSQASDFQQFVEFWSKLYGSPNVGQDELYTNSIGKQQLQPDDIQNLYVWKNGGKFSDQSQQLLDVNIKSKLTVINRLKDQFNEDIFQIEFSRISAVWQIFLRHIIQPRIFPIYDQNTHRAWLYINGEDWENIITDIKDDKKLRFYTFEYCDWIVRNCKNTDMQKIDRAMFAFGQFLKTQFANLL